MENDRTSPVKIAIAFKNFFQEVQLKLTEKINWSQLKNRPDQTWHTQYTTLEVST